MNYNSDAGGEALAGRRLRHPPRASCQRAGRAWSETSERFSCGSPFLAVARVPEGGGHGIACGDGVNAVIVDRDGTFTYYRAYQDYLGSLLTLVDDGGRKQ